MESAAMTDVLEKPAAPWPVEDIDPMDMADPAMLPAVVEYDAAHGLMPVPMEVLQEAAFMISKAISTPPDLRDNRDACLSIAYQAARWRMDPVAVASKCYATEVRGKAGVVRLAYEAQLVSALVASRAPITKPLRIEFFGQGQQRYCVVTGRLHGADEDSVVVSPTLAQIKVKNSPLWHSDPDQQLSYYTVRAWARRHAAATLMGIYTPDEMQTVAVRDITARPDPYDDTLPLEEVTPTVDGEEQVERPIPEPSGGADAAAAAGSAAKQTAKNQGREEDEPEDMADLRAKLGDLQKACISLDDAFKIDTVWQAAAQEKWFRRVVTYAPDLVKAARAAVGAHVQALAKAADEKPFPGE